MSLPDGAIGFIGEHGRSSIDKDSTDLVPGLGVMGYPMAINLRSKNDPDRQMFICDVNQSALDKFQMETQGKGSVEIKDSAYQVIQAAVCISLHDAHILANAVTPRTS